MVTAGQAMQNNLMFLPVTSFPIKPDNWDPVRGFREPGEWGQKQSGSREHDAKKSKEQGAEESNLGIA